MNRGTLLRGLEMDFQLGIARVALRHFDDKRASERIRSFAQVPFDLLASEVDILDIKVAGVQDNLLATLLQPLQGQCDLARASLVLEFDGQIGCNVASPPFVVIAQSVGISAYRRRGIHDGGR